MFDQLALAKIPAEDEALRETARALAREATKSMTLAERSRSWQGFDPEFSKKLGKAGFLGLTIPEEYGGGGRGPFARFVVVEEFLAAGAPVAAHWIADRQSAPLILNFGDEEQRRTYIPPICKGELLFCIGMSEPGSGSDLASVRTRAEKVKDGWRINGQKVWTTGALHADCMIALVRTSGSSADRHRGLSQLIIELDRPGVTIKPIVDLCGDAHFAEVFFDDAIVPSDALIGAEGQGWEQCTAELAFERSGPERIYSSMVLLDAWVSHLRQVERMDGCARVLLGEIISQMSALRSMSIACTSLIADGESPVVEASLVKDLGTALEQRIARSIGDDLASNPEETISEELRRALTYTSYVAPSFSLRGGTREILRGIIARGLGLR